MRFHIRHTKPPTHPLRPVNPNNARHLCITAAAGTELAVASSLGTVRSSSRVTGVYDPKAFVPHAASLRHAFAHCGRFSTAASRRSLGSVSVPVWVTILSDHLPVVALVSRYLTNKLIGREPILRRIAPLAVLPYSKTPHSVLIPLSRGYPQP